MPFSNMEIVEIKIRPSDIGDDNHIFNLAKEKAKAKNYQYWRIDRKSLDARKQPVYRLRIELSKTKFPPHVQFQSQIKNISHAKPIHIIGAGPAGYFAALEIIKLGFRPILFERGKDVRERRKDLRAIQQFGEVNPESNYCFGEGGAGTYSDGKLYTRSHKRGNIQNILEILVDHGAKESILYDAHPHIGSNKLPKIIAAIRDTIINAGGEIHFNTKITDINLDGNTISSIVDQENKVYAVQNLILATGHSARDIFAVLHTHDIAIEAKPFALGVRIEHPQHLIDKIQYGQQNREDNLPASSYRVVYQVRERGVFSFCMCPGGLIVPAATAPGEIVVNGMSLSKRDSPYANSGFVTEIRLDELASLGYSGIFGPLHFQQEVEKTMFEAGDGSQKAPALTMTDFVEKKSTSKLNPTSYIPGLINAPLYDLLPKQVYNRIARGLQLVGEKMPGLYTAEANVVGVESRTSCPIRIPRDKKTYKHTQIVNLYPCGEGAGYAGGILSAAMDGQRVAQAICESL